MSAAGARSTPDCSFLDFPIGMIVARLYTFLWTRVRGMLPHAVSMRMPRMLMRFACRVASRVLEFIQSCRVFRRLHLLGRHRMLERPRTSLKTIK